MDTLGLIAYIGPGLGTGWLTVAWHRNAAGHRGWGDLVYTQTAEVERRGDSVGRLQEPA